MAWSRQRTNHYLSQCWLKWMSPYGVTIPNWLITLLLMSWLLASPFKTDMSLFPLRTNLNNLWHFSVKQWSMNSIYLYCCLNNSHVKGSCNLSPDRVNPFVTLAYWPDIFVWINTCQCFDISLSENSKQLLIRYSFICPRTKMVASLQMLTVMAFY